MRSIFSVDNKLFYYIGKITDVLWISLLWVVASIPVVTIGPATSALYYTVRRCIRLGESCMTEKFIGSFKENFKNAMLVGVPLETVFALLWLGCNRMAALAGPEGNGAGVALTYAFFVLMMFALGIFSYVFPLLARFQFRAGDALGTAFQMAVRHLPSTVILAALLAGSFVACAYLWIPVFFLPAVWALIATFLLERIFKKYVPSAEEEMQEE